MSEMKVIHTDIPSQFYVLSDGTKYQLEWLDSRLSKHVKDIEKQDYEDYMAGKRNGGDLMTKAAYGVWPAPKEVQDKVDKARATERPATLISDPDNQKLFTEDELKLILPNAEKVWIQKNGNLPGDYVSPLKQHDN